MAIKKKFPYRAAIVVCKGTCNDHQEIQCMYGCIGCGKCIDVCKFDAVHMNADNVADIDEDKCIACGRCVKECPQQIIHIHECANYIVVKCSNKDKGKPAKDACLVSCVGCGLCEKICTTEAIRVIDNCAVIEDEVCLSCGMCAMKCPRHAIVDTRGILTTK